MFSLVTFNFCVIASGRKLNFLYSLPLKYELGNSNTYSFYVLTIFSPQKNRKTNVWNKIYIIKTLMIIYKIFKMIF